MVFTSKKCHFSQKYHLQAIFSRVSVFDFHLQLVWVSVAQTKPVPHLWRSVVSKYNVGKCGI